MIMKRDDSIDQLTLMAQMMSDDAEFKTKSHLSSYLPVVVSVLFGVIVSFISLYSVSQWEDHVENSILTVQTKAIHNEIDIKLSGMERNTNALLGFVEGSDYVTDSEFVQFSNRLITPDLENEWFALFHYKDQYRLHPKESNHIARIESLVSQTQSTSAFSGGRYLLASTNDGRGYWVLYMTATGKESVHSGLVALTGVRLEDIVQNGLHPGLNSIQVADPFGHTGLVGFNPALDDRDLNTTTLTLYGLDITLKMESNQVSALTSTTYLKWFLVAFSLIFTLAMCLQYLLARRSIRQLANLAVRRANDLSAINSDLTDEIFNRINFQAELVIKNDEIQKMNAKLEDAQNQLIQQEKLASLGQLAAGVAHEINNPVGYINSNLAMLKKYSDRALALIDTLDTTIENANVDNIKQSAGQAKRQYKLDTLKRNMVAVIEESQEGLGRVKKIVQDLKDFSRIDESEWKWANLHEGIDSTLNIAWNEIKYNANVHKDYGELPEVECVPSQINQVIMNLLVNSAHAMETSGNITIRTRQEGGHVKIEVEDDGCGIPDDIIGRIFDPFFTTKDVGKGTGLGLSLSYGIIQKHNGNLLVESTPGTGTKFTIILPIQHFQPSNQDARHE